MGKQSHWPRLLALLCMWPRAGFLSSDCVLDPGCEPRSPAHHCLQDEVGSNAQELSGLNRLAVSWQCH